MLKDVAHRLLAGNFLKVDRRLEVCGGYTRRSSVVEMLKRRVSPRSRRSSVILDTLPKIAGGPCVEWISYPRGTADVFCPPCNPKLEIRMPENNPNCQPFNFRHNPNTLVIYYDGPRMRRSGE